MGLSNQYEDMFYQALKIRLIEEKLIELYPSDKIQSPVHLSIGQEAVAVGVCKPLKKTDIVFCTYRSHAFYLAKGGNLNEFFAELYGKSTGCGKGKAGSMHLLAPEVGLMQASAVVASTIPHAVGAAMASRILKKDQMIVSIFGDGAVEEGVFHESMNFASLHKLPMIFICENNSLAVHSHLQVRQAFKISELAKVYGLDVTTFEEGYDFVKVSELMASTVDRARTSQKPQFLEIKTFRYKEHVGTGDDFSASYRSFDDYQKWRAKDPLVLDEKLVSQLTPKIKKEIDDAVEFAEKSPFPSEQSLFEDVI